MGASFISEAFALDVWNKFTLTFLTKENISLKKQRHQIWRPGRLHEPSSFDHGQLAFLSYLEFTFQTEVKLETFSVTFL